jgi:hypothetical protein
VTGSRFWRIRDRDDRQRGNLGKCRAIALACGDQVASGRKRTLGGFVEYRLSANCGRVETFLPSSCAGFTRASMPNGRKSRAQHGLPWVKPDNDE